MRCPSLARNIRNEELDEECSFYAYERMGDVDHMIKFERCKTHFILDGLRGVQPLCRQFPPLCGAMDKCEAAVVPIAVGIGFYQNIICDVG